MNQFDYVRETYGVPAKRGMRVTMNGKPGVITGASGQYVLVRFDGQKNSSRCHPTWEMNYEPEKQA